MNHQQATKTISVPAVRMFLPAIVILAMISGGCASCFRTYDRVAAPDSAAFMQLVPFPALREAFLRGELAKGMPLLVFEQVFPGASRRIPVASVGTRQELEQAEGMTGDAVDPSIKVWMREQHTSKGTVRVWYRFQDLHRMEIEERDVVRLCPASSSTISDTFSVEYIRKDRVLRLTRATPFTAADTLTAEITQRHDARVSTYWYRRVRCVGATLQLLDDDPRYYPLLQIEVNGEKDTPFSWR
jgi:hypothetical protein